MNLASGFREVSVLLLIQYKRTGNRMYAGGVGGGEVQMSAWPRQYICKAKNSPEPIVIKEFHTKEGASEETAKVVMPVTDPVFQGSNLSNRYKDDR